MINKKRKLAAIMFCDIEGYTSLMQKDEAHASGLLQKFRNTLNEKVTQHSGEVINNYGDGCLCTFESAVDAMACAKEVQLLFQEDPKVPVRIGLHSGDVFFEDGNVFGDSVNVASRIETLGVAGAVLFSEPIKRHISNQASFEVQSLGEFDFKNVEKTIEVFALTNEGLVIPQRSEMQGKIKKRQAPKNSISNWVKVVAGLFTLAIAGYFIFQNTKTNIIIEEKDIEKSIAVLPFENLSDSKENQYFADGMMEDILNNLAKVKKLRVTSRTTSMQYRDTNKSIPEIAKELNTQHILEGSVQRIGNQVKIVVQLIKAENDAQIWSEKYERELKDIFKIQSEVAEAITNTLKISLLPTEKAQINYKPTANMEAYDLYLKGRNKGQLFFKNRKPENLEQATALYNSALEIEPSFALAKVALAQAFTAAYFLEGKGESLMDSAVMLTEEALVLVPDLFEGYVQLGNIEFFKGNRNKSIEHFQHAVDLRPNSSEAINLLASVYRNQDIYEKAIPLYKRLLLMNPQDLSSIGSLGFIYRELEYYDISEKYLQQTIELNPNSAQRYYVLATYYLRQEKFSEALSAVKKSLAINNKALWYNLYAGEIHSYLGQFEEAIPYFETIMKIVNKEGYHETSNTPPFRMRYAYVLWNVGQKEKANTLLEQAMKKHTRVIQKDKYKSWGGAPYDLAAINAFKGNKEQAYYWLDEAVAKETWLDYRHAAFDPLFESIRHEERFQAILRKKKDKVIELRKRYEAAQLETHLD